MPTLSLLDILQCPLCGGALQVDSHRARCQRCDQEYPRTASGQIDFRPPRAIVRDVTVTVGQAAQDVDRAIFGPITMKQTAPFPDETLPDATTLRFGNRLTPQLLSHFPRCADGGFMLDLGCGDAQCTAVCRRTGLEYVGIDYAGAGATVLGDTHALPFRDETFRFVLSLAVLEHVRNPWIALHEAYRVLCTGGMFIGSVAFLEPYHERSHFHHSWLAIHSALVDRGFHVERIEPNEEWSGLRAVAKMALFPRLPLLLSNVLVAPLQLLHRAWWKLGRVISRSAMSTEEYRLLSSTAGYRFIARKL